MVLPRAGRRPLAVGRQRTPEAIGELVAALDDEDEQLHWLATISPQRSDGGPLIATLQAYIDQATSEVAKEDTERSLGKLTQANA